MKICKEIYQYRQMIFSLVKKTCVDGIKVPCWAFVDVYQPADAAGSLHLCVYLHHESRHRQVLSVPVCRPDPVDLLFLVDHRRLQFHLAQKDLIKKIYFPREVIPISYVTSCFVNMLLCFLIIFPVMVISGISLNPLALLCLPVIMIVEYFLALGMAMLSSAVTVYFRDLEHILGIITMVWMYMTPIFYSIDMIPEKLRFVYHINPMSSVISCYRDVLYYAQVPDLTSLLEAVVLGALFLVLGMLAFGKLKKGFAEEL